MARACRIALELAWLCALSGSIEAHHERAPATKPPKKVVSVFSAKWARLAPLRVYRQ